MVFVGTCCSCCVSFDMIIPNTKLEGRVDGTKTERRGVLLACFPPRVPGPLNIPWGRYESYELHRTRTSVTVSLPYRAGALMSRQRRGNEMASESRSLSKALFTHFRTAQLEAQVQVR